MGTGLSWGPSPSPAQGGEGNRTQQQPCKFSSCSRTKRELRKVVLWRGRQQLGEPSRGTELPQEIQPSVYSAGSPRRPPQFRAAARAPCNPLPVLSVCALGPTVRGGPGSPLHRMTASGFRVLALAPPLGSAGRHSEVLPLASQLCSAGLGRALRITPSSPREAQPLKLLGKSSLTRNCFLCCSFSFPFTGGRRTRRWWRLVTSF